MCREAKGLYEGAMTQARAQNEVKFLKEMLTGRPDEFALFLARFKMEAPRLGRGRVHFNLARFRAYIQSKQGMGVQWKAKMMDASQYHAWARTPEGGSKTYEESVAQWQIWSKTKDSSVIKSQR